MHLPNLSVQVYQDLQNCLDTQVSGEARAVEDAMGAARGHVEGYAPIKNEWVLQVRPVKLWIV